MSNLVLSIIIPAHNEEGSIERTIGEIERVLSGRDIPHEIVVVDDHSRDGTAAVVERMSGSQSNVRLVRNVRAGGFGNAIHTGFDHFEGDAAVIVMADCSDDPRDIVTYYEKLLEGFDCVFGSRFVRGGGVENYPRHKLLLNRIANWFIELVFGIPFNDTTNAFKAYKREVIDGIRPILSHHFNLTVELPLKAVARGYSFAVVPIRWYGRVTGVSKLKIREMGSRYLFIVLYVYLERLLSRGDYNKPQQPEASIPRAATRWWAAPRWAWAILVPLIALRVLFAASFPLNHQGGDTSIYYGMLTEDRSSLVVAGGYPYAMNRLVGLFSDATAWSAADPEGFRRALLWIQHGIDFGALVLLLVVTSLLFGPMAAAIATAVVGANLQVLGIASSAYPEWLQASLLVASMVFVLFGVRAGPYRAKIVLYGISGLLFGLAFLAKFNAAVFAPFFALCLFAERGLPAVRRLGLALCVLFAAMFVIGSYQRNFHAPSTGTNDLTYDHSWVLMAKLDSTYGDELPRPEAIASARWIALSSVLPPHYALASAGPFQSVDAVPAAIRDRYTADVGYLFTADRRILQLVRDRYPLPEAFDLRLSSIPISYYMGLKESDDLGIRVYRESVLGAPGPFIRSLGAGLRRSIVEGRHYPLFPTERSVAQFGYAVTEPMDGELEIHPSQHGGSVPFAYSSRFSKRGFQWFSRVETALTLPPFVMQVAAAGFLVATLMVLLGRSNDGRAHAMVITGVFLFGFILFSSAVFEYRWKEERVALPFVAALFGATVSMTISGIRAAAGRLLRGSRRASAAEAEGDRDAGPASVRKSGGTEHVSGRVESESGGR